MELWLLRHAHAPWTASVPDHKRPLDDRGAQEADRMGAWMQGRGLLPDYALVSPALRTRQTATRVLDPGRDAFQVDDRIYEAHLDDLLRVLHDVPASAQRILLVGHNPGIEELIQWLAPRALAQDGGNAVGPCTLVRLDVDAWRQNGARVLEVRRARDP